MTENKKTEYLNRLTTIHNGKRFIDDYLQGSGNELKEKFWSDNSSSRLAFDLYSWIPGVQFEKQLPGVICSKSGPAGVPNMDVFVELHDTLLFIESKYTESANLSYTEGEKPNLSKAYWSESLHGKLKLEERFYGQAEIAHKFSQFCKSIQSDIDRLLSGRKQNPWKWFDVKQETCHLFGIIFYALNARKDEETKKYICDSKYKGTKKLVLCNIIWRMDEDDFTLKEDSLPAIFEKKAKKLINEILGNCFDFQIHTVQKVMESRNFYGLNFKESKSFEKDNLVIEQMNQYKDCKPKR